MSERVLLAAPRGTLRYDDDRDHFENGLLRLLGMDRAGFERWLTLSEAAEGDIERRLASGFRSLYSLEQPAASGEVDCGPYGEPGRLWHASIAENPGFGVARAEDASLGWLVQLEHGGVRRVLEPPVYEEAYFEGDPKLAGGYGSYAAQGGWRLEKAARQLREVREATGVGVGRALDVGSGYGYFRKALADAGFEHEGIEPSAHARAAARASFGFETRGEPLDQLEHELVGRFDLVTLWDTLEHVADPRALLASTARCLRPGGVLALKTPNLDCLEADVFGAHYHSLKREHLVYLGAGSLQRLAAEAGLATLRIDSLSHLLRGFLGVERNDQIAASGRGADLVGYFRR